VQAAAGGSFSIDAAAAQIEAIARKFTDTLRRASPKSIKIEMGFEFRVESGQLTALLVKGEGKASIKVTAEWETQAEG
jgi:hypothetical protein